MSSSTICEGFTFYATNLVGGGSRNGEVNRSRRKNEYKEFLRIWSNADDILEIVLAKARVNSDKST